MLGRGTGLPDHRLGRLPLGPGRLHGVGCGCCRTAAFVSRAETPRPVGLVGVQPLPAARGGVEFADIRPFRTGDRLRGSAGGCRSRSRELHVTTSPAEEDSGVLLVVDALGDHGHSGGPRRRGQQPRPERPGRGRCRGAPHPRRRPGGSAHRRRGAVACSATARAPGTCACCSTCWRGSAPASSRRASRSGSSSGCAAAAWCSCSRRCSARRSSPRRPAWSSGGCRWSWSTPSRPTPGPGCRTVSIPQLADLAWRMRRLERDQVLAGLAALGCPVGRRGAGRHPRRRAAPAGPPRQRAARRGGGGVR